MWMQKQCLSVCLNRRHTRRFSRILFPGRSFALWLNALRCFKLFRGRLFFFFFLLHEADPSSTHHIQQRHFYEQTFLLIVDEATGCMMQQLRVNDAADSRSPAATSAASLSPLASVLLMIRHIIMTLPPQLRSICSDFQLNQNWHF